MIRAAEKNYCVSRFSEIECNVRKTRKLRKSVINSTKKSNEIREIPDEITNKFNEYFINVCFDLAKRSPLVEESYYDYLICNISDHICTMFVFPVESTEITTIVKSLQSNKSESHDKMSPRVIMASIDNLVPYLTDIFDLSLTAGDGNCKGYTCFYIRQKNACKQLSTDIGSPHSLQNSRKNNAY